MSAKRLPQWIVIAVLAVFSAACDTGGSNTVANPNLGGDDGGYNGPAARTEDIRSFQLNFWTFLKEDNRCGQCHGSGQTPTFVDLSDVNAAYSVAIQYVSLIDPASSQIVAKAATGHHCWLGQSAGAACASNIEQMIINWATDSNVTSGRQIQLTPPTIKSPGDAKSFPASATDNAPDSFANRVHPILVANCQGCHTETAQPLPIAPFFASNDVDSAYEAAKPKMDIDTPANSRFVVRLGAEFHNCWTSDCGTLPNPSPTSDAGVMLQAITDFAGAIAPTPVDPLLVTSMALNLGDGIVAAGGNRHEANLVALWEFRTGSGNQAFDTSGIDPSITLQLNGSYQWLGGYGLDLANGWAFANNFDSEKLKTFIESTGEYAIEAWVVAANVTQEDASILGYTGGSARNFTLEQNMYDFRFYNRIDDPNPQSLNGEPFYTTGDSGEELVQSSLQHVVANYDPINGRSVYVNGQLVAAADPVTGPTTIGNVVWDDNFAFVLGADAAGSNDWDGQVRLVAIHNRVLTQPQILQNFDVGVGQKFYLLFYVGHRIGIPDSYILFEVSQFDSYSYLFNEPRFINLDPAWTPGGFAIQNMRIGINGKEALAGQAFANIDVTVNATNYNAATGQLLSPLGTIIALEKGSASDEFFLTFELIGTASHTFVDPQPGAPAPPADPPNPVASDIGMRTFEEINSTIAAITGVPTTNAAIESVYADYVQQLPTVEAIDAFLPSHQMAIAQLALTSCSELVEDRGNIARTAYFPTFDFNANAQDAFDTAGERALVVDPILTAVMNIDQLQPANNLTTQPTEAEITNVLGAMTPQDLDPALAGDSYDSLITQLLVGGPNDATRTRQIVKAVCAAATGAAVMIVQ